MTSVALPRGAIARVSDPVRRGVLGEVALSRRVVRVRDVVRRPFLGVHQRREVRRVAARLPLKVVEDPFDAS
jgi:hypothetical protein